MHVFRKDLFAIVSQVVAPMVALVGFALFCCLLFNATASAHPSKVGSMLIGKKESMTTTNPIVEMDTNKGKITIEVFTDQAPGTAENFLDLVKRGFYNGLTFHRYEPGFVIQGGDPKGDGTGGFIDPSTNKERRIRLEVSPNLKHDKAGMVAMARSSDPNSASCQFYITLAQASFLDMQYAVFGKVVSGLDVVEQLRKGDRMTKVSVMNSVAHGESGF